MAYSARDRYVGFSPGGGGGLPKGVKWLLISNVAVFILYFIAYRAGSDVFQHFRLVPSAVVQTLAVWQLVTYLFLHSPVDPWHIVFNMINLWMVGTLLEQTWGTRRFLKYYFVCGVGAGICVVIANYLAGTPYVATIGASGAIYGLLLAFGLLFPDAIILLIIFPIKAKYGVMILGGIAFLMSFPGSGSSVSHVAHLGGLLVGYVYLKMWLTRDPRRRIRASTASTLAQRYQDWKRERARRKFQVYMRKHGSDRDRWTN